MIDEEYEIFEEDLDDEQINKENVNILLISHVKNMVNLNNI